MSNTFFETHAALGLAPLRRAALRPGGYSPRPLCTRARASGHWGIFSQLFKTFFGVESDIEARAINQNTAISKLIITDENIRQLEYWNDHGHVPGLETTL